MLAGSGREQREGAPGTTLGKHYLMLTSFHRRRHSRRRLLRKSMLRERRGVHPFSEYDVLQLGDSPPLPLVTWCLLVLLKPCSVSVSLSHAHTLSLSVSFSVSHSHYLFLTHSHTRFFSLTHTHPLALSHTLSFPLSLSLSRTHTPSLSHTHTLNYIFLSFSHNLSLPSFLTISLPLSLFLSLLGINHNSICWSRSSCLKVVLKSQHYNKIIIKHGQLYFKKRIDPEL